MEVLLIPGERKTPHVSFNPNNGELELEGRSIHENSHEFFRPLLEWIIDYCKQPAEQTTLTVQLEYYNSSSLRFLKKIISILAEIDSAEHKIAVKWYYESSDLDVMEEGETLKEIVNIPFEVIEA